MPDLFQLLLWFSAFACGAIGAVALGGMTIVSSRLTRLERERAADEMLAFVSAIERPPLAAVFFASALSCVALMLLSLPRWSASETDWPAILALLGGGFYLLGAFVMSFMFMEHVRTHISVARDERQEASVWPLFLLVWRMYFLGATLGGIGATFAFAGAIYMS